MDPKRTGLVMAGFAACLTVGAAQSLAAKDAPQTGGAPAVTNAAGRQPESAEQPRRIAFAERMEQLKKESPAQYAEMQKRREESRQALLQRAQKKVDFLASIDTKNMSDAQRQEHAKLLAAVTRLGKLVNELAQPGVEGTQEKRREMGDLMSSIGELYAAERRFLFEDLARSFGLKGTNVAAFADQAKVIIENTSDASGLRRPYTPPAMPGGPRLPAPAGAGQ